MKALEEPGTAILEFFELFFLCNKHTRHLGLLDWFGFGRRRAALERFSDTQHLQKIVRLRAILLDRKLKYYVVGMLVMGIFGSVHHTIIPDNLGEDDRVVLTGSTEFGVCAGFAVCAGPVDSR